MDMIFTGDGKCINIMIQRTLHNCTREQMMSRIQSNRFFVFFTYL